MSVGFCISAFFLLSFLPENPSELASAARENVSSSAAPSRTQYNRTADEIRVSAKRPRPESARNEKTLFSTQLATEEVLAGGRSIAGELARRAPAVILKSTGGEIQSAYLLVRGASPVQTAYFLDGLPLMAGFGGLLDAAGLPAAGFGFVELFRGAVPAEFGPYASGGAINFVPFTSQAFSLHDTRGSFGTWKVSILGGLQKSIFVTGAFSYATTAGNYPYFSNGGTIYTTIDDGVRLRENNHVSQAHAILSAGGKFGRTGRMRAILMASPRRSGVPGPYAIVTLRTHHERTRLRAQLTAETTAHRIDAYAENVREHYHDPAGELGVGTSNDLHDFRTAGLRHRLLHRRGRIETALVTHAQEEWWVPRRMTFGDASERKRFNLWMSGRMRMHVSRWDFLAVVHGAFVHPDPHPTTSSPAAASNPSRPHALAGATLGARARLTRGLYAKGNLARAFREPAFSELYGDFGVVKGNPGLLPEQSINADTGIQAAGRIQDARWTLETAIFGRKIDNLIQYIPNSQFVSLPVNVGSARIAGLETGAAFSWHGLDLHANGAFLHTRNLSGLTESDGKPLPGRPRWAFSAALAYMQKLRSGHQLRAEISWSHQRDAYFDLAARRPMPDRHTLDLQVSWKLPGSQVTVSMDARNLTNNLSASVRRLPDPPSGPVYHPQAVCDQLGYPIPGRSFFLTLSVSP